MDITNSKKREMVKADYDAIAETYIKNCSEIDFYLPYVDKFILNLNGKRVLDLGCGQGVFTNYFHKKGLIAEGIDFSENLLGFARKSYPDIKFIFNDFCDYEAYEKYDGIFIKNVLFHVPETDIKNLFLKFNKWLNENGKVCVLMEIPKEAGEQILSEEFDENLKIYYNYMMPEKVESLLKEANFSIDKVELVKNNKNATIYAYGLMVINATRKKEKVWKNN